MNRPTKKPPTLTDQIRGMKKNQPPLFFPEAQITSVKAIASRLGSTSIPKRRYVTEQGVKSEDPPDRTPGVWVWRLK